MEAASGSPTPSGHPTHRQGRRASHAHGRIAAMGSLCLAAVLAGCGGHEGRVPVYSAKGKVTIYGEVPDGALVVLYPVKSKGGEELRPSGRVKPDGAFSLTT